jgi:L-alanine-DL-glutamate epimerase-like enolase superfamily enzyme
MNKHTIADIQVHLISVPVTGNYADATRQVETAGMTVVRVITDQGLEGIGTTYHEVGGRAIRAIIEHEFLACLKGKPVLETEIIWDELFTLFRGVGRKGLAFCALSAVDIALWDLKGKILGLPLCELLGGRVKKIPIYASGGWTSYDDDALVDEALEMVRRGYRMIKLKVGYDGGRAIRRDVDRIRKVREAIGPDIALAVDANNAFTSATAVQLANRLREYDILLFEEPVLADDIGGLASFKRGTDIPLATGEHEYTVYGARELVSANAVDILQVDVTRCGGFTELLKIIAISKAWNLGFAPHAMELMHMHIAASFGNALYLERLFLFEDVTNIIFPTAPKPNNGYLEIPNAPGLGLHVDWDGVKEYED